VPLRARRNNQLIVKLDFFPNDKKNTARRMRIDKFEQFGGNWVQQWNPSVKIIILDNDLTFANLIKFAKIDKIPVSLISHVLSLDY
jgi:DNA polymerase IV